LTIALLAPAKGWAQDAPKGDEDKPKEQAPKEFPDPPVIREVPLGPVLPTIPVRRDAPLYNMVRADTAVLPLDTQGIWVLKFAFRPVRIIQIERDGKRRYIHYMFYQVVNRTGKPRMFVPQFTLVTDTGKRYQDTINPIALKVINSREDPTHTVLGPPDIQGMLPVSKKEGIDDAIYGVAIWENVDPKADRFTVYVRGLSDGYKLVAPPQGGQPVTRYKTLQIGFIRRGDEHDLTEREIELLDPPFEWIYY
jgi:hypothetical protein